MGVETAAEVGVPLMVEMLTMLEGTTLVEMPTLLAVALLEGAGTLDTDEVIAALAMPARASAPETKEGKRISGPINSEMKNGR